MQFNNPSLNKKQNMTTLQLNKINGPVAFAACSPYRPARVRLLWAFARCASSYPGTRWRLCQRQYGRGKGCAPDLIPIGAQNTAIGRGALRANRQGSFNTGVGAGVLEANVNGVRNTATGFDALTRNAAGSDNTANGERVLSSLTQGSGNTAMGANALFNLTGGNSNIAIGAEAGYSLTTGNNNIYIGNKGVASEFNTIRIGTPGNARTFIGGINGAVVSGPPVVVNAGGQLGIATSSQRFKDEIKPMDKASEAILALKPVSFCYKKDIDPPGTPQFGLVAEDVEKVNPDLVMRDKEGKPFTVRYDAVNAMLLNEFLKAHRKIEKHGAAIVRQQEQIDALAAGLQKVSARLEMGKSAPRTVLNSQ